MSPAPFALLLAIIGTVFTVQGALESTFPPAQVLYCSSLMVFVAVFCYSWNPTMRLLFRKRGR